NSAIDRYKAQKDYAPLADLLYSVGKIESLKSDFNDYGEVLALYPSVLESGSDKAVYRANIAIGLLYNDIGRSQEAYRYVARANIVAQRLRDQRMLLESEYYLGEFGMKKGDFNLLFEHIHNALQVLRDNPSIEFPLAPRVYNYQASIMHFSSKPDSANFYFKKALDHIPHLEEDPENSYYLPGTIYGNWFMVKQSEGDYTAAMEYSLRSVAYFNLFLSGTRNHPLTSRVHGNLSIAYRNIAALYNYTGNREKAKKFAQIAYRHAKANFSPNTMSYFSAMLMMGEAYLYDGEGAKALDYLKEAERSLMDIEGENYLWKAQMASVFANYYYKNGDYAESVPFFETATWNYTRGNPEGMDQNQQYNLMNLAMAHASNHNFAQA